MEKITKIQAENNIFKLQIHFYKNTNPEKFKAVVQGFSHSPDDEKSDKKLIDIEEFFGDSLEEVKKLCIFHINEFHGDEFKFNEMKV